MKDSEVRAYFPKVSQEFAELVHQGTYLPNVVDWADEVYTRECAEKIPNLLRVVVEARPQEILPALVALPPDAEVVLRERGGDSVVKAWLAKSIVESKIQRQARGFFELSEAAEILSESCADASEQPIPSEEFFKAMSKAFFSGQLPFFNHGLTLMDFQNEDETFNFGMYGETTTPKAINAWLESTGSPHKFPEPTTPPTPPVVAETTGQRRARWLDWYGSGERGAVQRVYERELQLNPKADRPFIGKEIKKAKKEKTEIEQARAMFGQLVKDGKRTG